MSTNPNAARVLSMCDYRDELSRRATQRPWTRDPYDSASTQVLAHGNEVVVYHNRHSRQIDSRVVANHALTVHACNSFDAFTAYMRARCEDCMSRLLSDDDLRWHGRSGSADPCGDTRAETLHDLALSELSALAALCATQEDAQYAAWKAEEGRWA